VKRNAAYLGPVDAFEDAFRDLRNHETVTMQAMRAAFNSMLDAFSPDVMQVSFNKVVKQGALWSGPIKLRYWELYRERYKDLTKDIDQCFRELFADEFVRAYTTQLDRLKRSSES
jgi:type VI secretion system FHA domain protein